MGGQDENKENPPPGQREFKVVHAAGYLAVFPIYAVCLFTLCCVQRTP